jgi:hypothetical protein
MYMNLKTSYSYVKSVFFLKLFREHFIPRKPSGNCFHILDGRASHFSESDLLELADSYDTITLSIPSHKTRAFQPMDRSFINPVKAYYNQEVIG